MTKPADLLNTGVPKLLYSVEEAACLLGIGRTFMFFLVTSGDIESIKLGKHRKIPYDALIRYVEQLRAEQAAAHGDPVPDD